MQRDCCNRPKSKWCRINHIMWKRHRIVWSLKIWQSRHLCNQLKQHIAWPSRRQCSTSNDHISHNTLINSTPLTLKPVATIPPHLAGHPACCNSTTYMPLHRTDLFQTYVPNLSTTCPPTQDLSPVLFFRSLATSGRGLSRGVGQRWSPPGGLSIE